MPTSVADTAVTRKDGIVTSVGKVSKKIGTFELTKDMAQEFTTLSIPTSDVDEIDGK